MRSTWIDIGITACALFIAVACADGDSNEPVVETSPDGHRSIYYSTLTAPAQDPLEVIPGIVFGAPVGDTIPLWRPSWEMALDDHGRLYIWDGGTKDIRKFNSDGSLAGAIGRSGSGPGEFGSVMEVSILDGRLYAFDGRRRRMIVYGLDGVFLHEVDAAEPRMLYLALPFLDESGVSFVGYRSTGSAIRWGEDTYRYSILVMDSDWQVTDTIVDSLDTRPTRESGEVGNPFEQRTAVFAMRSYSPVAWIQGPDYRVNCYDPRTQQSWTIHAAGRRRDFGADLRKAYLARYEGRPNEEEVRRTVKFPQYLPEIGSVVWDDEGRLWVWVYEPWYVTPDAYEFDVFDTEGRLLFSQQLPPAHPMLIEGGALYVHDELEDGSPVIRQYVLREK